RDDSSGRRSAVGKITGCVSILISPPPSSFTLFPYTTLFRSPRDQRGRQGAAPSVLNPSVPSAHSDPHRDPAAIGHRPRRLAWSPDRKSTRLNSSHDQTSYAVFCLKRNRTLLNTLACWRTSCS